MQGLKPCLHNSLQKLLEAVRLVSEVTARLSAGQTDSLDDLCALFLDNIQASVALHADCNKPIRGLQQCGAACPSVSWLQGAALHNDM